MACAIFTIGFSLAYAALGLNPTQQKEIHRLEATMSVDDAMRQLKGKLPGDVAALMQGWRDENTARKSKKLNVMALQRSVDHETRKMDKRGVETARLKLNEMVEGTQETWDREEIRCKSSIANQGAVMEQTSGDMSLYSAQNTQAKGDHLRAEGTINTLDTTSTKLKDELTESTATCAEEIAQLNTEIAIMINDSIVLQRILGMIDCPKKAGLVQCDDTQGNMTNDTQGNVTTFEKPELREQMSKLQSSKVKGLVQRAVLHSFETAGIPKKVSRAVFFQHGNKAVQTLKRRQRVLRGAPDPNTQAAPAVDVSEVMDKGGSTENGPGPDGEPCSLASNPNCGKLQDKFMEIAGEVDSDITVYSEHLETKQGECKAEKENYEAQINDLSSRLENWQTALAEATQRAIQAAEGERLKRGQYVELEHVFKNTVNECAVNIGNYKSEICALGKIRGELYKMSSVPKFIEDCEVGPWIYHDCSKDCMESTTDIWGIQNLTREVTTPASLGADCPPLKLSQECGKVRCPVDCIQTEWSEWSGCSTQCGGGIRERIRSIKRGERFNGEPCGPASETQTCNLQDCDKDCTLGPWSKIQFVKCSKACGGGVKVSERPIAEAAIGLGECPDPLSAERFRQTECNVAPCQPQGKTLVCDSLVDVVILLDGSGSLGKSGWAATLAMGQTLAAAFDSPSSQAQVAVQLFSGPDTWYRWYLCTGRIWWKKPDPTKDCGIEWVTPLTSATGHFTQDMKKTSELIKGLKWPARATFTSMALAQAQAETLYGRDGVPKVVVVVTDGVPTNPSKTSEAADKLKSVARLIWVPVTAGAPKDELREWASTPIEQNVVPVEDFKVLVRPEVVTQIIADVCPEGH